MHAYAEMSMGRGMGEASAVVGYAGGKYTSPDGRVCYYLSDPKVRQLCFPPALL